MRYLGLDVGERHIGVAVGELLASELTTIDAPKDTSFYQSPDLALETIKGLVADEQADAIVIGRPVAEDGQETGESKKIAAFGQALSEQLDLTIHYVNETLSSFMAADILEGQGLSVGEAKAREHQLAAQLILQQFLEENETA